MHSAVTIESMANGSVNGILPVKGTKAKLPDLSASTHDKIRIVDISEYQEAARALAVCFKEDLVAKYFLFEDATDPWTEATYSLHVQIFNYIVYAHCMKGLVTTVGPNYDSVALWYALGSCNHRSMPSANSDRGCLLDKTWMIGIRCSNLACGVSDTSSRPKDLSATSQSSCPYCIRRSTTSCRSMIIIRGTWCTSARSLRLVGRDMLGL